MTARGLCYKCLGTLGTEDIVLGFRGKRAVGVCQACKMHSNRIWSAGVTGAVVAIWAIIAIYEFNQGQGYTAVMIAMGFLSGIGAGLNLAEITRRTK